MAHQRHVDVECETVFTHGVGLELLFPHGASTPSAALPPMRNHVPNLLLARLEANGSEVGGIEGAVPPGLQLHRGLANIPNTVIYCHVARKQLLLLCAHAWLRWMSFWWRLVGSIIIKSISRKSV